MKKLDKNFEECWCVYDHGNNFSIFEKCIGPTIKEEAEYYLGKNPHYELIRMIPTARRFGGSEEKLCDDIFKIVEKEKVELEGPFECSVCGGHLTIDFTFLDQVSDEILCPYCGTEGKVDWRNIVKRNK